MRRGKKRSGSEGRNADQMGKQRGLIKKKGGGWRDEGEISKKLVGFPEKTEDETGEELKNAQNGEKKKKPAHSLLGIGGKGSFEGRKPEWFCSRMGEEAKEKGAAGGERKGL